MKQVSWCSASPETATVMFGVQEIANMCFVMLSALPSKVPAWPGLYVYISISVYIVQINLHVYAFIYIYATPKIQCSYSSSGLHIIMVPKATNTFKKCRERPGGSTQGNASQDMAYDTAMMDRVTGRYVGMDQWWALALRAPIDLPKRCRSLIEVNEVIRCFSIYFAVANILIDLAGSRSHHDHPAIEILMVQYY